jgi:hypothetical protein
MNQTETEKRGDMMSYFKRDLYCDCGADAQIQGKLVVCEKGHKSYTSEYTEDELNGGMLNG